MPEGYIGVSTVSWIGNYWAALDRPAAPATDRWWRRLRNWIRREGVAVPGVVPLAGDSPRIYAFPNALDRITAGAPRYAGPSSASA